MIIRNSFEFEQGKTVSVKVLNITNLSNKILVQDWTALNAAAEIPYGTENSQYAFQHDQPANTIYRYEAKDNSSPVVYQFPVTIDLVNGPARITTAGGTTLILPAMQAGVSSSYITQGAEVKIKRGDGCILPVQIAGDWSLWTARCGAKVLEADDDYAVGPITLATGVYDAGTNITLFNVAFTSAHTITAYKKLYAEVELSKTGSDPYTPLVFFLTIKQDVVRDIT